MHFNFKFIKRMPRKIQMEFYVVFFSLCIHKSLETNVQLKKKYQFFFKKKSLQLVKT